MSLLVTEGTVRRKHIQAENAGMRSGAMGAGRLSKYSVLRTLVMNTTTKSKEYILAHSKY